MASIVVRRRGWRVQNIRSHIGRKFTTSAFRQTTYGFVGLGAMGYPMAKNILAKAAPEDRLVVYDTNIETTKRFAKEAMVSTSNKEKVTVALTPVEAAAQSETIITVLPTPDIVKRLFQEIVPALPDSETRLFIDCSTIDPGSSRSVASLVQSSGKGIFIDAPMSGGVIGAVAGSLTFMIGFPASARDLVDSRVKPVLEMLGRKIWEMGDQGAGLSAKIANNYLVSICNIATAEAFDLGIKWGLDPKALADVINSSTGRNWVSEVNNPLPGISLNAPASRNYEGGFAVSLMKKDLKLAKIAAQECGAKLQLANQAEEVYSATEQEGYFNKDVSVVYKYLQDQSLQVPKKGV
ncbi:3-hydroxyisobutyrate dehydrogenase [Xylogone sp. PMI_703]|nr:3-hydroxyisobutyrate dehydrogenase [Xylogone sp. PMI_703]